MSQLCEDAGPSIIPDETFLTEIMSSREVCCLYMAVAWGRQTTNFAQLTPNCGSCPVPTGLYMFLKLGIDSVVLQTLLITDHSKAVSVPLPMELECSTSAWGWGRGSRLTDLHPVTSFWRLWDMHWAFFILSSPSGSSVHAVCDPLCLFVCLKSVVTFNL